MNPQIDAMNKDCNSNEELWKATTINDGLKVALNGSFRTPINLMKAVFQSIFPERKTLQTVSTSIGRETSFSENILDLTKKNNCQSFQNSNPSFIPFLLGSRMQQSILMTFHLFPPHRQH